MIIRHKECFFTILAPDESKRCLYLGCKRMGDFHIFAKNDRDQYIFDYPNICDAHIIHAFLDMLAEE